MVFHSVHLSFCFVVVDTHQRNGDGFPGMICRPDTQDLFIHVEASIVFPGITIEPNDFDYATLRHYSTLFLISSTRTRSAFLNFAPCSGSDFVSFNR